MAEFAGIYHEGEKFYGNEIFMSLDDDPEADDGIYGAMEDIQNYLHSSYILVINPLPGLRRLLPQFKWQFHRPKTDADIRKLIRKANLVWSVYADWFNPNFRRPDERYFVTAVHLTKEDDRRFIFGGRLCEAQATELEKRYEAEVCYEESP